MCNDTKYPANQSHDLKNVEYMVCIPYVSTIMQFKITNRY